MDLKTDWYAYSGLFYIASALSWSLFYNGVQYEYRKRLSGGKIYKKGFFDKKVRGYGDDHNDAQFNPGFGFRLFMFIIGSASVFTILRVILDF